MDKNLKGNRPRLLRPILPENVEMINKYPTKVHLGDSLKALKYLTKKQLKDAKL